jgi:thiosulfate/3-mercaptopyruvate sulfurtransferase
LRRAFESVIGPHPAEDVVHMCGSGVTACHNLLAMEYAGLFGSRLYAPSWSGWVSDRSRGVATGDA